MFMKKIDKKFVSSIDQKLAEFDKTHPFSASQEAEVQKYARIMQLRDQPENNPRESSGIWDD